MSAPFSAGLAAATLLPLGGHEMHDHLPVPGLAGGVLHEVMPEAYGDRPAALGFLFVLMSEAQARPGPAVIVVSRRALTDFESLYGHGLGQLGLKPSNLIQIQTRADKDALWAIEETLRSDACPAMVAGALAGPLDFTMTRRLNLAAAAHATPLVLLRPAKAAGTSAAATRWRIATAPAARDRFGALGQRRWQATLERCRNGRPGHWLIEWDHVAHRFRMVESMADRAPAVHAGLRRAS